MLRTLIATFVVALAIGAPLRAELKFTTTMAAKASTAAATAPANPLIAMIAPMVAGTLLPPAPVQMITTVGALGVRTEYDTAYMMVPAGGVAIVKPDGTYIVLDPAKQTYWKTPKPDMSSLGIQPVVTVKATGEKGLIAGLSAEKWVIDIRLPIPVPAGTPLPPGMPTEFAMTGEAWINQQHKAYGKQMSMTLGALGALGFEDALLGGGFPMRLVMRGELLGAQELEYAVTSIGETTAAPGLFDIPAGYKEVPVPQVGIGGIGGRR